MVNPMNVKKSIFQILVTSLCFVLWRPTDPLTYPFVSQSTVACWPLVQRPTRRGRTWPQWLVRPSEGLSQDESKTRSTG